MNKNKKLLVLRSRSDIPPDIASWLGAFEDCRNRTLALVAGTTAEQLQRNPSHGRNTISALLYHIAAIEASWLYEDTLQVALPPEVETLFPYPVRANDGHLTNLPNESLENHLTRLSKVRQLFVNTFERMSAADFRRLRTLEQYDVTPEWVMSHLIQHEAYHRHEIATLLHA